MAQKVILSNLKNILLVLLLLSIHPLSDFYHHIFLSGSGWDTSNEK